ncbi:uncharacterized protein BP01DRAFT_365870 [Aspergillus saccharolyticus JOP 1030-1]|uniref:Uncharacterized protein n=1 Tax=Aspergillus saccharolyticus JOP 1030-1 TaxID=1450539 RepID=A0A318ZD40_9EURO|nr:hypothetical protein BP01DRAFT_365870 [Aspergillus saccharolyticus JOP 1030-1]PYH45416.1 hypothetical protein BP01DRAFT_365870 [Aspergillus saccharolyticus JOP 1030-1]
MCWLHREGKGLFFHDKAAQSDADCRAGQIGQMLTDKWGLETGFGAVGSGAERGEPIKGSDSLKGKFLRLRREEAGVLKSQSLTTNAILFHVPSCPLGNRHPTEADNQASSPSNGGQRFYDTLDSFTQRHTERELKLKLTVRDGPGLCTAVLTFVV